MSSNLKYHLLSLIYKCSMTLFLPPPIQPYLNCTTTPRIQFTVDEPIPQWYLLLSRCVEMRLASVAPVGLRPYLPFR